MSRLLEATNLNAAYLTPEGREVKAVDDVSLYIDEGEILGCAGESGCGKSTLGNVLALTARPPLYPISGRITIDGQTISLDRENKVPRTWRGEVVSMLPQGALNSLSPTARIRNLVGDVMKAHDAKMGKDEALDRARDRMKELGLPPRALDAYPHELSGGMKQRVITVISTLLNPKLLIADEPTSALDVSSQRALVEMLREMLNQGIMKGVIFVTHDLPLLKSISDRIAVMYAGQIVEVASAETIADNARHPYSTALLNAVLAPEPDTLVKRVEGIRGAPPSLAKPPSGCRFHPRCGLVMDICSAKQPAPVGTDLEFACCHWTAQHPDQVIRVEDVLARNDEVEE
ncbi:ABC transporter ATP-binding protein [Aestuariimicrobium ganziense]|uniref:ABC transporter ATP-binding protein n=1 Tax=Aestuariimicrobium ganziense TaxID=2773677 RepID=UPI0019458524|nr:ABC transporter ATP-binding protein [Aestuariimicrobium ganziense]